MLISAAETIPVWANRALMIAAVLLAPVAVVLVHQWASQELGNATFSRTLAVVVVIAAAVTLSALAFGIGVCQAWAYSGKPPSPRPLQVPTESFLAPAERGTVALAFTRSEYHSESWILIVGSIMLLGVGAMFTASAMYFSSNRPVAFAKDSSALVDAALMSLDDGAFVIADQHGESLWHSYPAEASELQATWLVFERALEQTLKDKRPESPEAFKSAFLDTLGSQTWQDYSFDPSSGLVTLSFKRDPGKVTYKVDSNQVAVNLAAMYSLIELSGNEKRGVEQRMRLLRNAKRE